MLLTLKRKIDKIEQAITQIWAEIRNVRNLEIFFENILLLKHTYFTKMIKCTLNESVELRANLLNIYHYQKAAHQVDHPVAHQAAYQDQLHNAKHHATSKQPELVEQAHPVAHPVAHLALHPSL